VNYVQLVVVVMIGADVNFAARCIVIFRFGVIEEV